MDFIWYLISRTDVCVALNAEFNTTGLCWISRARQKMKCVCHTNKYYQVDNKTMVSWLQCDCGQVMKCSYYGRSMIA